MQRVGDVNGGHSTWSEVVSGDFSRDRWGRVVNRGHSTWSVVVSGDFCRRLGMSMGLTAHGLETFVGVGDVYGSHSTWYGVVSWDLCGWCRVGGVGMGDLEVGGVGKDGLGVSGVRGEWCKGLVG